MSIRLIAAPGTIIFIVGITILVLARVERVKIGKITVFGIDLIPSSLTELVFLPKTLYYILGSALMIFGFCITTIALITPSPDETITLAASQTATPNTATNNIETPIDTTTITTATSHTATLSPTIGKEINSIAICILPTQSDPYLIHFEDVKTTGLIISENAKIIVGSNRELMTDMYTISPHISTGGYQVQDHIISYNASDIPTASRESSICNEDATFASFGFFTQLLNVSPEYTIILSFDSIQTTDIYGIFAFHFYNPPIHTFQILQLVDTVIKLNVSGSISENYVMIANKSVKVTDTMNTHQTIEARNILINRLQLNEIDLFEIMGKHKIDIYPYGGIVSNIKEEQFLQVESSRQLPHREFKPGDIVRPLNNANVTVFHDTSFREVAGNLTGDNSARVINLTDYGYLTVSNSVLNKVILPAWLVEVLTN